MDRKKIFTAGHLLPLAAMVLSGLFFFFSCGRQADPTASLAPEKSADVSADVITAALEWKGSSDLDLEVWSAGDTSFVASAYDLDSIDVKRGGEGEERILFRQISNPRNEELESPPALDTGTWLLMVTNTSALEENTKGDTEADAVVVLKLPGGEQRIFTKRLSAQTRHWAVCHVTPASNKIEAVDRLYQEKLY